MEPFDILLNKQAIFLRLDKIVHSVNFINWPDITLSYIVSNPHVRNLRFFNEQ